MATNSKSSVIGEIPTELDRDPIAMYSEGGKKVLVAEDHRDMRRLVARTLRLSGYDVIEVANGFELMHWVDLMTQWTPSTPLVDMVVTDVRMPMFSGLECLAQLHYCGDRTPVILITAFGDEMLHREAAAQGALQVFDKPLDLRALRDEVVRVLG